MAGQKNFITELEDLGFQIEMLSGVAFVLWESLVKPEVCEENYNRARSRRIYCTTRQRNL